MSFSLPSGPLISGAAFFSLLGEMLDAFALDAPGEGPIIDP